MHTVNRKTVTSALRQTGSQGSHETSEMKFHDFSMTFHDQISDFPWPFPDKILAIFQKKFISGSFGNQHIRDAILNSNLGEIRNFPWPFPQLRVLQIFQAKFIAGQFWKIPYLGQYFECELGQNFYFSMTFDIFVIFHDFSMTFHDHEFFHDFPWLWEPCIDLTKLWTKRAYMSQEISMSVAKNEGTNH